VHGAPGPGGKAHAALVSDSDLAVAWCQSGAVAGRARRQLAEIDQIVPPPAAREWRSCPLIPGSVRPARRTAVIASPVSPMGAATAFKA
jgi:hypothetical protein